MIKNATVYKVLLSAPGDIIEEKQAVVDVLHKWNRLNADRAKMIFLPIHWETDVYSEMGASPQDLINEQIVKTSDILIGVLWTRIGTKTERFDSGTVEEIEQFIESDKHVMLFFSNAPVMPQSIDRKQFARLEKFKKEIRSRGLYSEYCSIDDFKTKLFEQLTKRYSEPAPGPPHSGGKRPMSEEEKRVLKAILEFNDRRIHPRLSELKPETGLERIELLDILHSSESKKFVEAIYVAGNDPGYRVKENARRRLKKR